MLQYQVRFLLILGCVLAALGGAFAHGVAAHRREQAHTEQVMRQAMLRAREQREHAPQILARRAARHEAVLQELARRYATGENASALELWAEREQNRIEEDAARELGLPVP